MRSKLVFFLFFAVFAISSIILVCADDGDTDAAPAEDYIISGHVTLHSDLTIPNGTRVVILDNAVIDIGSYTLDFGRDSHIIMSPNVQFQSSAGKFVIGFGTDIILLGAVIPSPHSDVTIQYNGSLTFSGLSMTKQGAGMHFFPYGSDPAVSISWDHSVLSIDNPSLEYTVSLKTIGLTIGSPKIQYKSEEYDGGTLAVTSETTLTGSSSNMATLTLGNGTQTARFWIDEAKFVDTYHENGSKRTTDVRGIGEIQVSVDKNLLMKLSGSAEFIDVDNSESGTMTTSISLQDTAFSIQLKSDIMSLINFILPGINHTEVPVEIRSLDATCSYLDINDRERGVQKRFSAISAVIDGQNPTQYFMKMQFEDGSKRFTILMDKAEFALLSISRSLMADVDATIPEITVTVTESDKVISESKAEGIGMKASSIDLMALYSYYAVNGDLTVREILDDTLRLELSVASLSMDRDHDGEADVTAEKLTIRSSVDDRGYDTLDISLAKMSGTYPYNEGTLNFSATDTELYIESDGSVDDILDAFTSGIHFTEDTLAEFKLTSAGASIMYLKDSMTMGFEIAPISSVSPKGISVVAALEYLRYNEITTFGGNMSAIGYAVRFVVQDEYTDPDGNLDCVFESRDMTGTFGFGFDDKVSISLDLHGPMFFDIDYYDIDFETDLTGTTLGLNHGVLDIDGYSPRDEGILAMLHKIRDADLSFSSKVNMSVDRIDVYRDSRQTLYNTYLDTEISIKDLSIGIVRDDKFTLSLERFIISLIDADGTNVHRTLDHLDIEKDLSGKDPEQGWLEQNAMILLVIFSVISAILAGMLIRLRIKRPELFRFTDTEAEENEASAEEQKSE
jgi:hypothetical protein